MISKNSIIERLQYLLKVPETGTTLDRDKTVSRARETLADTISPYRWSDEQLSQFLDDGVSEIKNLRSDMDNWTGIIPDAFRQAIANYVVHRALALDNDAQNNNGALSDKFLQLFTSQAGAIPYFFTEAQLAEYTDLAVEKLIAQRTDLRIADDGSLKIEIILSGDYDLPERFAEIIADYAAFLAAFHAKDNASAEFFINLYNGGVATL
jgi:hypothetical protein